MKVLISLLNWNSTALTQKCIESILKQNYTDYQIAVVDNDSSDDSINDIESMSKRIKLFKNDDNLGYAEGHKVSMHYGLASEVELLWLLNVDVTVHSNTLDLLVSGFVSKPNAILGSLVINESGHNFPEIAEPILDSAKNSSSNPSLTVVDSVHGASMIIPASIIRQYGWMKPDYFMYYEELDYCRRLFSRGICSYLVINSVVDHMDGGSFSNENLKYIQRYYLERNGLLDELDNSLITRSELIQKWGGYSIIFLFLIKHLLFFCGFGKLISFKFYIRSLAFFHAIINRRGKTLAPEDYWRSS